jgi:hypothetical protein
MRYKLGQEVYFKGQDPYILVALITDLDDLKEYVQSVCYEYDQVINDFIGCYGKRINEDGHKGLYLIKVPGNGAYKGAPSNFRLVTEDLITSERVKDRFGDPIVKESSLLSKYNKFREFIYKEYARDSLITFLMAVSWGFVLMIAFGSPDEHTGPDVILFGILTLLVLPCILRFLAGVVLFIGEVTYAKFYSMNRLLDRDLEDINFLEMALSAVWLIIITSCLIAFFIAPDTSEGLNRFLFSTRSIIIDIITLYYIGIIPFMIRMIFRIKSRQ